MTVPTYGMPVKFVHVHEHFASVSVPSLLYHLVLVLGAKGGARVQDLSSFPQDLSSFPKPPTTHGLPMPGKKSKVALINEKLAPWEQLFGRLPLRFIPSPPLV